MPFRRPIIFYSIFFLLAVGLNFIWESAHAGLYICPEPHTLLHLLWFSVKDALWFLVIALCTAKINRQGWRYTIAGVLGLIVAAFTEYHALATGRWTYTSAMLTLPFWNLGLSPLLQMSLGLVLTLWLSRFIASHFNKVYTCRACGFSYAEKKWAAQCEAWCREHHSCNTDIIKHALPPTS